MMKILLILISLSLGKTDFCAGYENGYKKGYCYNKYGCLEPLPTVCPTPSFSETSYQDGYTRGFLDGMRRRAENG